MLKTVETLGWTGLIFVLKKINFCAEQTLIKLQLTMLRPTQHVRTQKKRLSLNFELNHEFENESENSKLTKNGLSAQN